MTRRRRNSLCSGYTEVCGANNQQQRSVSPLRRTVPNLPLIEQEHHRTRTRSLRPRTVHYLLIVHVGDGKRVKVIAMQEYSVRNYSTCPELEMSAQTKFKKFISEPVKEKPVQDVPGIRRLVLKENSSSTLMAGQCS